MAKLILVNKPIGLTPLQTLNNLRKFQLRKLENKKLTYVGRLDPMASGLLLVLVDPDQVNKDKLQALDKTYQFQILFGVSTDTYDPLGLIQPSRFILSNVEGTDLEGILSKFIGTHLQPYPPYSSKTVKGKPLFYYARTNQLDKIKIPSKKITIKKLKIISSQKIKKPTLKKLILQSIKLVKGDFRQPEVIKSWQNYFKNTSQQSFSLHTLEVNCSSGTYVRSLAHQIGQKLNTQAIALNIHRTKVGPYSLKNTLRLT